MEPKDIGMEVGKGRGRAREVGREEVKALEGSVKREVGQEVRREGNRKVGGNSPKIQLQVGLRICYQLRIAKLILRGPPRGPPTGGSC